MPLKQAGEFDRPQRGAERERLSLAIFGDGKEFAPLAYGQGISQANCAPALSRYNIYVRHWHEHYCLEFFWPSYILILILRRPCPRAAGKGTAIMATSFYNAAEAG